MKSHWTQAKITARYKRVLSTVFFSIGLPLSGTSIPRKYSIFIQQINLFHFGKIFPKNPWVWEPCCETVRNDKKLWDARQNRESWRVCKFIQYLCFIIVVFIHSCHLHLKMSSFNLKKKFRSINLTCGQSTQPLHLQFLTALNTSSWKDYWSKGDSSHFENSPSFQISWTWGDVFSINENFIQQLNCPPCLDLF